MAAVSPKGDQGTLFGSDQPATGKHFDHERPEVVEEEKSRAIYGDLTVEQVFDQVSSLVKQHGGTYRNYGWNGAGEVEVFFLNVEEVLDFFREIDAMCGRYQFRAKFIVETSFDIHPDDSHGIRYNIRSVVPAPITIKK